MRASISSQSSSDTPTGLRPYATDGFGRPHSTEVNLLLSAAAGLTLSMAFLVVISFVTPDSRFGQIFLNRGWVTKAEVALAAWAVCFMALKQLQIRRQRGLAADNPLALAPAKFADCRDLREATGRLARREESYHKSVLHRRAYRGLERADNDGNRSAVAETLHSLALLDASRTENSYSILRVLIWAIPIVGFIGTVAGLGGAVGGFSESLAHATDFAQLKSLLGGVTAGLSVAFDATFVALLISLILMFPASHLEKRELDFLTDVDEFCQHELLGRLNDSSASPNDPQAIAEAFREVIQQQQESFLHWWKQANDTLMESFNTAAERVGSSASRLHEALIAANQQTQNIAANLKTGADHSMRITECLSMARAESEGVRDALAGASASARDVAGQMAIAHEHSQAIPTLMGKAQEHVRNAESSAKSIDQTFQDAATASEKLKGHIEKTMRAAAQNVATAMASQMDEFNKHTAAVAKVASRLQAVINDEGLCTFSHGNGNGGL